VLSSTGLPTESSPRDHTVVIIGSGPPAAAAAVLLTKAGVNVTVLEAGLPQAAWGLTARIAGITVARLHRRLELRTSDVSIAGDPESILFEDLSPGGLTNHWSCAVPRFSQDDFEDARRAGTAYTWPIDYSDLAPWYDWVEPQLRISGTTRDLPQLPAGKIATATTLDRAWQPIIAAAERDGQALVSTPYVYGGRTTVTFSGSVFNAHTRLLKPARRSGRLTIQYGKRVTQLEWSGAQTRVVAVIARDVRTGVTDRIRCRAVIVAAGAINTAKILLQSTGSDFPDGLGNANGVLGRYLHDHPLGKMELEVASPIAFDPAAYLGRLPLVTTTPLYAASCVQWSGTGVLARSILAGHPRRSSSIGFNVFGTMPPTERNFIATDPSRVSGDGTPGLVLNIHHPPESTTALVAARDQLVRLLDEAGLTPRIRGWVVDCPGSAVHFAGTCRMHASPQYGMLDRWSRLHAVPNVVVADSSAFTTGPEKNPVLTAMALAARASQRLVEDLRVGNV
jgi:choline dehydrogenase-like flavoprotein